MSVIKIDGPARLYIGDMCCKPENNNAWAQAEDWSPTGQNASATFQELGVTENGVQVSFNNSMHRINSDDYGGNEGVPAELLMMSANAIIRGTLVRYGDNDQALALAVAGLYYPFTKEGTTYLPGTAYFGNNYGFSLLIIGFANRFYFPKCEMVSQPREFNISSTERKTSFSIQAYPVYGDASGYGSIDGNETGTGVLYRKYGNGSPFYPECKAELEHGWSTSSSSSSGGSSSSPT